MGCGSSQSVAAETPASNTRNGGKPLNNNGNVADAMPIDTAPPAKPEVEPKASNNLNGEKPFNKNDNGVDANPIDTASPAKPEVKPGDRVHVRGYVGTVKFVGCTSLGEGVWVGIALDKQQPQGNSGSHQETSYFQCQPKHGLFARPGVVHPHSDVDMISKTSEISPNAIVFIQTRMKRMLAGMRLRRLVERSGFEREIDKHVQNTPASATASINQLSDYLTECFSTDREKAFAIYRWLTFNVAYDVDGFFGRSEKKSTSAEDVLSSRTSVCAGYASLYTALGEAAGLEIHNVSGYAKGYGHKLGQRFEGVNHAWNVLKVDNTWYVSDATWGAGFVGDDMLFTKNPNTYRFLQVPDEAIFDHLPEEEKWQFLDPTIDKASFERSAKPSCEMLEMGIELESHKDYAYETPTDTIDMTFYCPGRKMLLMGKVKTSSGQALEGRERVRLRFKGLHQIEMRAQFPNAGTYKVEVYVVKGENSWNHGVSYEVTASQGCGWNCGGYPKVSNALYDHGFTLEKPLENIQTDDGRAEVVFQCTSTNFSHLISRMTREDGGRFPYVHPRFFEWGVKLVSPCENIYSTDGKAVVELELPGVSSVSGYLKRREETLHSCTMVTGDGERKLIQVHTPEKGEYELNIFAKRTGEEKNTFLLRYIIHATQGTGPNPGFPVLSNAFRELGLRLLDDNENITISGDSLTLKLANPKQLKIIANLKDSADQVAAQGACENSDGCAIVTCAVERAGKYDLQLFGSQEENSSYMYLCSFKVLKTN
ncbi:predicted protein [Nematostella vectensis]|uniref:CAP-Gly domain-containing protein n=1 Tax=Nematostella vectensis TaxID=45351 RepID=A7SUI9_NEMVE|nr:predicted protein [Nematostella vectensis]|eukprot:XP_001624709.1 predicted protein [Nematostella vectensis]